MDSLSNWIDEMLNLGDPEIRTWFLVRHKSFPLLITIFYIIFSTIIGPALMKNRKPFELRYILIVFNFSLVIVYASFLSYLIWNVRKITFHQFCHGLDIKENDITYSIGRACWLIYLIKYVEYLDTVFFILRKKQNQVTFLHVVHHSLVPICCWLVTRTENSGMVVIPGVINGCVHVIMYSYYGLSAFGPEVRKYLWWKRYLTQLQMGQFLLIITFALIVVPLSGCKMVITSYIIQFTLAPLFFYLFYMYYKSSFHLKKKSVDKNSSKMINNFNCKMSGKESLMTVEYNNIGKDDEIPKKQE